MRTRMTSKVLALICLSAIVSSCNKATPAGFWKSYHGDEVLEQASDQGPWGGSRWIQWAANAPNSFRVAEAVQFASENGWDCEEPTSYSADRMSKWLGRNGPVFPLFFGKPETWRNYPANDEFPRHILNDSTIVRCETGWIRVAPGSGESSPAFGYIHVGSDGRHMAVYHLWGEV